MTNMMGIHLIHLKLNFKHLKDSIFRETFKRFSGNNSGKLSVIFVSVRSIFLIGSYSQCSLLINVCLIIFSCSLALQSEVNFLGRLSHPNLVKLLGYCWEDKDLLLVYEFMVKGSLENHLFRSESFDTY